MTTTAAAGPAANQHRRRDRALGAAGQVAGVIGIVLCIALIVGAVLGRGWAVDTVDSIASRVDAGIGKALPPISTASGLVGDVSERVGAVADKAQEIADNPGPESQLLQDLQARLEALAGKYLELRTAYASVREQAVSVLDRVQTIDRLLPGVSLPQGPIEKLQELDGRIQDVDASIMGIIDELGGSGPTDTLAATIAERARGAQAKLDGVTDRLTGVATDLQQLQADLDDIAAKARLGITIGTIVAILLLLYFTLLHVILFRVSRRLWQTNAPAGTAGHAVTPVSTSYPVPRAAPAAAAPEPAGAVPTPQATAAAATPVEPVPPSVVTAPSADDATQPVPDPPTGTA